MIRNEKFINKETGEILVGQEIVDLATKENRNQTIKKNNYYLIQKTNNYMIKEFGNFYHMFYGNILNLKIEPQYMVRFLYLCSYVNYDNLLVTGYGKGQIKLKESDLQEILKLSRADYFRTKSILKEHNLILIDEDKNIVINGKYASKGKIDSKEKTINLEVIRMFENGIKDLYETASTREHKRLALFIKVLPYINIEHNIVCKNPEEKDMKKLIPYSLIELAEMLEYKNPARLKADLFAITVDGEHAFMMITDAYGKYFTVNPKIYCKSNNMQSLMAISNYFRK